MLSHDEINQIKEITEDFLKRIDSGPFAVSVLLLNESQKEMSGVDISVEMQEPQMLIGQKSQTLLDVQRILRAILNKKLKKFFYVNLDINDYKKNKTEYLQNLANRFADEALFSREKKILPPMENYERRIIHMALSQREDVVTESLGDKGERRVVISPRQTDE